MSSSYQTSKLQIKDFTNLWFVSEAFGFSEACVMLSDREKFVLHFVSMMTISRITGTGRENRDVLINGMIEEVRQHRCRSITLEDMEHLLEEINEEMVSGKILFQYMTDEVKWSMTGKRPNTNTKPKIFRWRDMR